MFCPNLVTTKALEGTFMRNKLGQDNFGTVGSILALQGAMKKRPQVSCLTY